MKKSLTDQTLNPLELAALRSIRTELRAELREHPETNAAWILLRFYNARAGNIKETLKMLKKFFEWRKSKNMDKIASISYEEFRPLADVHERGLNGVDKQGRPVIIERCALTDVKKFLSKDNDDLREDYLIAFYERILFLVLPCTSTIAKRRIDNIVVVYDLKGLNFGKIFDSNFKHFSQQIISLVQDYYPKAFRSAYHHKCVSSLQNGLGLPQSLHRQANSKHDRDIRRQRD